MNDQVAIITGAASGIGRDFATELRRCRPQMPLALVDVNHEALAEAFPFDLPFSPRACFRSSRVPPRVLLRLYEPLKGKGMKQIERVRRERGLA